MMTTKTNPVVYLTALTESERDTLAAILAPYSWATGELGMMLTDQALVECCENLTSEADSMVKMFLHESMLLAHKAEAGDICLNHGTVG